MFFVQKLLPVTTLQPLALSVFPHHESDPLFFLLDFE